jgi:hypothetical protein
MAVSSNGTQLKSQISNHLLICSTAPQLPVCFGVGPSFGAHDQLSSFLFLPEELLNLKWVALPDERASL